MLPEHRFISEFGPRYQDDEYLSDLLDRVPANRRKAACQGYSEKYLNKGRAFANTWLRNAIRKRELQGWN